MTTIDPNTGATSPTPEPGYIINSAVASIQNDLSNASRTFSVGMSISQGSETSSSLSVSIQGGGTFNVDEAISFTVADDTSFNMNTIAGTSSTAQVTMDYTGFTMVPIAPTAWDQATASGWFDATVLAQAWANSHENPPPTGYIFSSDQTATLGDDGKAFGQLTNVLISNYPNITINYTNADFQKFQEAWNEQASGNIKLFGAIPLGNVSTGTYSSKVSASGSNSSFSVTFTPSPQVVSVPPLQQAAYVIGGTLNFPVLGTT